MKNTKSERNDKNKSVPNNFAWVSVFLNQRTKREFVGVEKNEAYSAIVEQRIKKSIEKNK